MYGMEFIKPKHIAALFKVVISCDIGTISFLISKGLIQRSKLLVHKQEIMEMLTGAVNADKRERLFLC